MSALIGHLFILLLAASTSSANGCVPACVNGVCNNSTRNCSCPADWFVTFPDTRCDNVSTIAPGGTASTLAQTNTSFVQSEQLNFANTAFQGGFPVSDGVVVSALFICSNGYVTFDRDFCTTRIDLLRHGGAPSFIAPFATSFDYRSAVGGVTSESRVTHELVPNIDAVPWLSLMRTNISHLANTTSAIVVTWSRMSPATVDLHQTLQQITMQLIIFTDFHRVTVAAMLYSSNSLKHYFDWVPTLTAWKIGDNLITLASNRSACMAYANETVSYSSLKVRLRILPIYRNNSAPVNYAALCSRESVSPLTVTPSTSVASSCPETLQQARSDPRYTRGNVTVAGKLPYRLILTDRLENVTQLTCVYHNATGGLLVQDSSIQLVSATVSLGANLFDYCCNRAPALCSLYYNKFPQPSSSSYAAPGSAGFLMGAGLFRTFDNFQFKFMAIGDFWLVRNSSLQVQVRMDSLNLAGNRTAAVSAVAAQFTGTTNLTIEVHRTRSATQINNWLYSVNQGAHQNFTGTNENQTSVLRNAVIRVTSNRITCFTTNDNSWIEISGGTNGLAVSLFLTKSPGVVTGPLGNNDRNSQKDVAYRNGTVLTVAQQDNQALLAEAMQSWAVSAMSNESFFKSSPTAPAPVAGWTPLYWNAIWSTNQTLLVRDLFNGNESVYNRSVATCGARPSNTTEFRHCLLEFADCQLEPTCSSAYLTRLDSLAAQLTDLGCSPPRWNASSTPLSVKENSTFSLELSTLVDGGGSGRSFSKLLGPNGLSVQENGSLTWLPAQSDVSAPILLSVTDRTSGCASLWPVPVRLTRRDGLCPATATESFASTLASGSTVTPQNQAVMSSCACNENYYGANCSYATCPLNCYACTGSPGTSCSNSCPPNYERSTLGSLTICAYQDRCSNAVCNGGQNFTGCISADPALQTDFYKFQCICAAGFQFPLSNPGDKTRCEDINECLLPINCDTSKNRTCTNSVPGFSCPCSSGFEPENSNCTTGQCSCVDINECTRNSSTPACPNGNCRNTIGSYRCECNAGFYPETSRSCSDIDECANPGATRCTHNCMNTPGGFNCTCKPGFTRPAGDPVTCIAQSNCTVNCAHPSMCVNNTCHCLPNQTPSGTPSGATCTPSNFCSVGPCGTGGTCTEIGSPSIGFNCTCDQHFEKNSTGICIKKQYCTDPAKYPGVCPVGGRFDCSTNDTTNAPTCGCSTGYTINSNHFCVDVNECEQSELNSCSRASTDCFNEIGTYTCQCRFGYRRMNRTHCTPAPHVYQVNGTFTDLTFTPDMAVYLSDAFNRTAQTVQQRFEANLPPDGSGPPTVRVFSLSRGSVVGGVVATYNSATTPQAIASTALSAGLAVTVGDVNECLNSTMNECSSEHVCENTNTGYRCRCKPGYAQTGLRAGYPSSKEIADCVDIDECQTQCPSSSNRVCTNLPGSFNCSCVNGTYSTNPLTHPCQDPCIPGRCRNGGACQYLSSDQFPFRCVCTAGFTGFTCELTDNHYIAMQRDAVIIGVVLGVLLLIAIAIVVFCIIRKRRQPVKPPAQQQPELRMETRELSSVPVPVPDTAPLAPAPNVARNHGGNYRGTQDIQMTETTIPRVKESSKHPSAYQNRGFRGESSQQNSNYY